MTPPRRVWLPPAHAPLRLREGDHFFWCLLNGVLSGSAEFARPRSNVQLYNQLAFSRHSQKESSDNSLPCAIVAKEVQVDATALAVILINIGQKTA